MGRPRKNAAPDPVAEGQLRSVLSTLARSGAAQWFVSIRRRRPGMDSLWQYWKRNVLIDQVDDLSEYCYKEGGEEWEYRIKIHDSTGNPPTIDGKESTEYTLPSLKNAAPASMPSVPANLDPMMLERKKRLDERKFELEIEREEAELERKRRHLEKIKSGEDEDDDDYEYPYPPPPGYPGYHPMYPGFNPMYPGMGMDPRMMMNRPPQVDPNVAIMAEAFKALAPQRNQDSSIELLKVLVPLMGSKGKELDPKDWMTMMTPMITEMGRASAEANKIVMSSLADMDGSFRERLLDLIMADPSKSEDEIAKWKGYLGMGMDVLKEGTRLILGRNTISRGDGSVKVPVIEKPKTPGLPGPKGEPSKNPGEKSSGPAEEAKKVISQRVNAFLLAHEQELLVGSDPAWIVEKLDELWASLPQTLRFKLEHSDVATIYEELRNYDVETVDRILEAVKKDESGALKKWAEEFWTEMKLPPSDEDDEEEGDEEPEVEPDSPSGESAKEESREATT